MSPDTGTGRLSVPQLKGDPVWALKPWPVTISAGGREFDIPALPAADWLAVLMVAPFDPDSLVLALVTDGVDLLLMESIDADELTHLCLDVIALVSARPWWEALRLITMARSSWSVLGAELILKGVRADQISLAAWLDVLLLTAIRTMDKDDVTMFTLQLEQPPPEETAAVADELEMSAEAFLSMGF